MASVLETIKAYQQSIEKHSNDEARVLKCIDKLFHLDVTTQLLQETGVGRTVNALRKDPGEVGSAARALVYKWKKMVASEESDHEGDHRNDTVMQNGNGSGKESDDNSRQQKSGQDKYERSSNKTNHTDHRQMNGHRTENKRKHRSSEEEESNNKKRRHSTDDESNKTKIKQEKLTDSETDEESDSSESDSDSYTWDSSHEDTSKKIKDEVKIKQEKMESPERHKSSKSRHKDREDHSKESSSSKSSHEPEKYSSHISKSKDSRQTETPSKSGSHKHKSSHERENSSDKRHSNDKPHDEKREKESSKQSSKDRKSSSHKLDNGQEKHKNSSETHSSKSDKHRSSDKESEKHKSSSHSDNHRSSSLSDKQRNTLQTDKESERHKSSHSDKSDQHRSSDKESEKPKSLTEKEPSKHRSKESKSCSSKDKHSSSSKEKSKDRSSSSKESSSHSEKISSDKSQERSKHEKSDDKSEKKSKHKSSSSSHKSKSRSESNDEVPKKKSKKSNSEESEEGIDCGSGASFAEALGMIVSPVKAKKKSYKDMSPSNPFINDLSPAALLAPMAKLAPLPSLEISALPEISPNYKPRPPPRAMPHFTDEDAISAGISSKNQRTKVYSGNKILGKVTSLYEMCVGVLQEHIDALEYTGGVPYDILKPVIDKATPNQLFVLEHYNPYLMEDTDHLWQRNCEKTFRNKKRQEMETWREMYIRCQEEQESKLKSLTANIRLTQEAKKAPIKQTKMAYVDNFVKPPRSVARKQAIHGTAHSASASPAARVASLAAAPNVLKGGAPRPVNAASVSVSSFNKPKKAPLMQKALQFMRGRKR